MHARHVRLLELVHARGRMGVSDLAAELRVSQVTIRKDLAFLEKKHLLTREHGYAAKVHTDDIKSRLAVNYEAKRRIAAAAAAWVRPGETVMIESGSCCALLAEELAKKGSHVTIITNSAFIAGHIREYPQTELILLGGEYQRESQVLVGPMIHRCIEGLFVDKLFLGTDGFHERTGFSGKNLLRTEAVQAMAEHARRTIVLTESQKFDRQGVVAQFRAEQVYAVITDSGLSDHTQQLLQRKQVHVHTVQNQIPWQQEANP